MNTATNFQAYLTPLFIVFMILYVAYVVHFMTSKKNRAMFKKLKSKSYSIRRTAMKDIFLNLFARILLFCLFIFAYFGFLGF